MGTVIHLDLWCRQISGCYVGKWLEGESRVDWGGE